MAQLNRIAKPVKGTLNKLATSSPELEEVVTRIRGEVFEALAVASRQIGSLSTKLQARAEALQHAADVAAGLEGPATRRVSGLRDTAVGGVRGARSRARPPAQEEEEEPSEDEEEPRPLRKPPSPEGHFRPAKQRRPSAAEREPQDDEEPEDRAPRLRSRVQRGQPSPGSRPIRRARG